MWAEQGGKELHSLGIGGPQDGPREQGRWTGHMVAIVSNYVIDTTLYVAHRPVWPDLPGMIALPLAPPDRARKKREGRDLLAGTLISDSDRPGYVFSVSWFNDAGNVSWRDGGDCERGRRKPVVDALVKRFGAWQG